MTAPRGRFITFEGGEGCGKSTQVRRLAEALEREGIRTVTTREPGGTRLAELIRALLREEREDPPCAKAELLLFLAARAQLVKNAIEPALASGAWVVSDRFSDSTFAYQGYGRGLDLATLRSINDFACSSLRPDLTLLLDVDADVSASRLAGRRAATGEAADRLESAGEDFHARLRRGFLEMAAAEPDRIVRLDASGSPDEVFSAVWTQVRHLI